MHEIDQSLGRDAFTRRQGSLPAWHRLGGETEQEAPLEVWAENGGINFSYDMTDLFYYPSPESLEGIVVPRKKVVFRDDTKAPLGVVSDQYVLHQPLECLEIMRRLLDEHGFVMETVGALRGGAQIFAMARTGADFELPGGDRVKQNFLVASGAAIQRATIGKFVGTRVVCANTVAIALGETSPEKRVPHVRDLDLSEFHDWLGLAPEVWAEHRRWAIKAAKKRITDTQAKAAIERIVIPKDYPKPIDENRAYTKIWDLYKGEGLGANLKSAANTAWGLLNAVTEYADHHLRGSLDRQATSAWFGSGAKLKEKAFELVTKLAA